MSEAQQSFELMKDSIGWLSINDESEKQLKGQVENRPKEVLLIECHIEC